MVKITILPLAHCITAISILLQLCQGNEISLRGATAVLWPSVFKSVSSGQSSASMAIDGDNRQGRSGGSLAEILKCTSTSLSRESVEPLKYLKINMKRLEYISCVKLHLRDRLRIQQLQNGLTVRVSESPRFKLSKPCGNEAYNAVHHGQSPLFVCMKHAQYIWIVLRGSQWPLQVCEVRAYSGPMSLSASDVTLSHGEATLHGKKISASKAVDGFSAIGHSGGNEFANCAANAFKGGRELQFLRINLHREQFVLFIRLHLRDEHKRFKYQAGLTVSVGNSVHVHSPRKQCGSPYEASQGQSPNFICNTTGNYVWLSLRSNHYLQICEVEVYADASCKNPPPIANGWYRTTNLSVGGILSLKCHRGFVATSPKAITCKNDGNWSGPFPTCRQASCSDPPKLIRGTLAFSDSYKFHAIGSTVTYVCNEGYTLYPSIVSDVRTCQPGPKWSGTAPQCRPIDCGKPRLSANGRFVGGTTYPQHVRFECNRGYRMIGANAASCLHNGQWSVQSPECREIFCPELKKDLSSNAYLNYTSNHYLSVSSYKCHSGYERVDGSFERRCEYNATWTNKPLKCAKKKCPNLKTPRNGSIIHVQADENPYMYGKAVIYVCNREYVLKGNAMRKCQASGQWEGEEPICQHACFNVKCKPYEDCKYNSEKNIGECRCMDISQCSAVLGEVCGSNGKTYLNECVMKASACKEGRHDVNVAGVGKCLAAGICSSPKPAPNDGVTCRAYAYRYWFNANTGQCERFSYGGCFAGGNHFYTMDDCREKCIKTDFCKLPLDAGKCNVQRQVRWFYNTSSNQCQPFMYGGCFGNENNFFSRGICLNKCCVCSSIISRKTAVRQNDAIVVVNVKSVKSRKSGKVVFQVELSDVCKAKSDRAKTLRSGSSVSLSVRQEMVSESGCSCPGLIEGKSYRMAVNVGGSREKIVLPKSYYLHEINTC